MRLCQEKIIVVGRFKLATATLKLSTLGALILFKRTSTQYGVETRQQVNEHDAGHLHGVLGGPAGMEAGRRAGN